MEYSEFIKSKERSFCDCGFIAENINEMLFDYQKDIVLWACRKGRAAIFADCGLGKTPMQLEWSRLVHEHTGKDILILAPLAVSNQTCREGEKFGINVTKCRTQDDVRKGINITNYEMLSHFNPSHFGGVVLDESSILKSFSSKTRNEIIDNFSRTEYKLACTATPSPNDFMELGNHAEFLGAMSRNEMLAMYFIHDGGETSKWRLKGHASRKFWDFVSSWSVMLRSPEDLGYKEEGFDLKGTAVNIHKVDSGVVKEGSLINLPELTLSGQQKSRRKTISVRASKTAEIVNNSKEQFIVWCDLNDESKALHELIPDSVEVKGSDSIEHKEDAMIGFSDGKYRVIVTKPSICGFGMNWQNCFNMCFCGLSHSYEQYYQAVRRCHRFGQKNIVNVNIITTELEESVITNIMRKKNNSSVMLEEMISRTTNIRNDYTPTIRDSYKYKEDKISNDSYVLMLGDSCERIKEIPDNSVDFSIFSPPFASLYTYSNSNRDMGNCSNDAEFMEHFSYLVEELYRVIKPGRLVSFHCMNLPTSKERDGYIGIRDFRGDLIRLFQKCGFIYHSEVTIWKDPVIAMQRTKALGLLNKQKNKDSSLSRQGIPDYLVTMRKDGENESPIKHDNEQFPISVWQKYASPVWMDINPSRTLQYRCAKENQDERHICPLQLDVIDRAIDLWSKPEDVVLSPFMGIGSEGYEAILKGRKFIGIELKESYFNIAKRNIEDAYESSQNKTLLDFLSVV